MRRRPRYKETKSHGTLVLVIVALSIGASRPAEAQYIGATFGFNYGNDMAGPDDNAGTGSSAILNVPLYNPDPNNTNASWDTWVREAGQAGHAMSRRARPPTGSGRSSSRWSRMRCGPP